ncbi:MAG: thioredoxin family protein [Acidobacteria bacterium]|nr:thioredoxin family protein [Acidobacteriota bacterium]MCA1639172.1 thioredoxin family protein [Acidobacteriota bacterium]
MNNKRRIEIFSAGCSVCDETIALVKQIARPSCDVEILDMRETETAEKAKQYGVQSVPAVVVDGKLADCCAGRGVNLESLRNAGVGVPLM